MSLEIRWFHDTQILLTGAPSASKNGGKKKRKEETRMRFWFLVLGSWFWVAHPGYPRNPRLKTW
jgi:hypothetical protein